MTDDDATNTSPKDSTDSSPSPADDGEESESEVKNNDPKGDPTDGVDTEEAFDFKFENDQMAENDAVNQPGSDDTEGERTISGNMESSDESGLDTLARLQDDVDESVEEQTYDSIGSLVESDETSDTQSSNFYNLPNEAQTVLSDVKEHFSLADSPDDVEESPSESFIESRFFDFSYLKNYREIERKWVNKPYAFVSILENEDHDEYRYHVNEPALDEFEQYVLDYLVKILRNHLMYQDLEDGDDREEVFRREVERVIEENAASTVSEGTLKKLMYYLVRDFIYYGPIDPLMRDEQIEDISCDGVDIPVYIYHFDYRDLETNVKFNKRKLNSFTLRLAQQAGKHISISQPLVDGSLPDGSRVQLTFSDDVSTRGPNFTIRRFANIPYTPIDLINWNTFTVEQMAYFWLAIENNRSLIFSGGTGSGKTTSMNAVSFFIPEKSKVVSIEDTREVTLPHNNWIQSLTRDAVGSQLDGEITMYQLLQSALRQRPEYIIVGEIRTDSRVAFTFFQAIGTGHTAYTTIHADSVQGVLNRLQNDPLNVPIQMIQDLDIVSIQKQTFVEGKRVRRNDRVTEIIPAQQEEGHVRASDIFELNADTDTISKVNRSHVLQEIAEERGWSPSQLEKEINDREEVLRYLIQNDINGYHEVSSTLWMFAKNRDYLMEKIHSNKLGPGNLDLDINLEADSV